MRKCSNSIVGNMRELEIGLDQYSVAVKVRFEEAQGDTLASIVNFDG